MDVVAAPMCECLTGYFRNNEGLGDACPAGQNYERVMAKCTSKQTDIHVYTMNIAILCKDYCFHKDDANTTLASVYTSYFPHNRATKYATQSPQYQ